MKKLIAAQGANGLLHHLQSHSLLQLLQHLSMHLQQALQHLATQLQQLLQHFPIALQQ